MTFHSCQSSDWLAAACSYGGIVIHCWKKEKEAKNAENANKLTPVKAGNSY